MDRLWDLERAKVLAILLVVYGHIFGRAPPIGGEWWYVPESYIYLFHMPLFMFLSGFVFGMKDYHNISLSKYKSYVLSRMERLLLPFLVMGLIIILGKMIASHIFHVAIPTQPLLESILGIVGFTDSPVRFIWYLYTIFLFSIITPILHNLVGRRYKILILLSFIVFFVPLPEYLYLFYVGKFYFFFLIGGFAGIHSKSFADFIDNYRTTIYTYFLCASGVFLFLYWDLREFYSSHFWILAVSLGAIPSTIAFARSTVAERLPLLKTLSGFVFSIYLFNVPFIGVTKAVMSKIIPYTSETMLLYMPILTGAGIVGPILFRSLILMRFQYLKKMTA